MNFEQNLKQSGLKITPQRMAILQEIQRVGHATVEEIYENIFKIYPSISLATIYKNLASMCEVGIIHEIKPPLQKQRYEINHSQHSHLICQECGHLQDITLEMSALLEQVPQNFKLTSASASLYGVCAKCQALKKD